MSEELRVPAEPLNFDEQPQAAPSEGPQPDNQALLAETLQELEATKLRIEALTARVEEAVGPAELNAAPEPHEEPALPGLDQVFPVQAPVVAPPVEVPSAEPALPEAPEVPTAPDINQAPGADDFDYEGLAAAIGASPEPVQPPAIVDGGLALQDSPIEPLSPQPSVEPADPYAAYTGAPAPAPEPAAPVQVPQEPIGAPAVPAPEPQLPATPAPVEVPEPVAPAPEPYPAPEPAALPVDPVVQTQPAGSDPYASIIGVPVEEENAPAVQMPAQAPVAPVEEIPAPAAEQAPAPEAIDLLAAMAQSGGEKRAERAQTQETLQLVREQAKSGRSDKRTHKNTRRKSDEQIQLFPVTTRFISGRPLVITFTSPKGGVAKSTTAASMAGYLAKSGELSGNPVRVLLVDGDVANGNLALRVAKTLRPNMLDMLQNVDNVKASGQQWGTDFARDIAPFVLVDERVPNLALLAAPENASVINEITQQDLEDMVGAFARFYDVIIFDSGTQIVEHTNCAWLAFASQVYLMMEPEISCLHQTAEYAARAVGLNLLTEDRFRSVMIRADMDLEGMDPQKVIAEMFPYIAPDKQFYIPDFHRDGIATANAGEILSLESQDYATSITRMVQSALESYERENGLR